VVHGPVFSEQSLGTGPVLAQGWKLHVSANPFSAVDVLDATLKVLLNEGARFKVVNSVRLLTILNAGNLGLSQIGKYITVYPSGDAQAVRLAIALDAATSGYSGPRVPTDRPLRPESLVHYRYGAMHHQSDEAAQIDETTGRYDLLDPAGRLTTDVRLHYYVPPPAAIPDPFEIAGAFIPRPPRSTLLDGRYLVVSGLSQGLRGGVFRAIDVAAEPARFCLLKEAWHDVSLDEYGRDARDWLVNEEQILVRHQSSQLLPRFYDSFDLDNNHYIAIEFVDGAPLAQILSDRHPATAGIDVVKIRDIGRETAAVLAQLHEIGLVFRDFSPANVIVTPDGGYRLIDFGNAYDLADQSAPPIGGGTPPFYSREQFDREPPTPADDVFAWGAVLHYLSCGAASVADMPKEDYGLRPFPRRSVTELCPDLPERLAAVIDRAVAWRRADRYETMREAHRAFVKAADQSAAKASIVRGISPADPAPPNTESSTDTEWNRREWIGLAREVGEVLCADSEERGGGLCWAARNELAARVTYGPDLYSGAAGIGLFLAELASVTADPRYAEAARGAARWLAGPTWSRGRARHGLHCGDPGISYFFMCLTELLHEPGFAMAAELRMRRLEGAPFATVDLSDGTAGTILVLLALYRITGEPTHLALARAAGDELVRAALLLRTGQPCFYWDVPPATPGGPGGPYLGLLHGAAGIGLALSNLALVTGHERYLEVARGAAEMLLSQAQSSPAATLIAGDLDNDGLVWDRLIGDDAPGAQTHCHGAGGIGQFFLYLDHLTPDARYRDAAKRAARTVASRLAHESRSCLCHGLAGTGHLMLDCYQSFCDSRWLELALECGIRLQRFRDHDRTGVYRMACENVHGLTREHLASPDLMLGYAGVGSLFLRLADPRRSPELILGRLTASMNETDESRIEN
jgi:serine/threonine protein kinase